MTEPKFVGVRLYGYLAKDALIGVIVRRGRVRIGPHAWYQLILWHTDTDRFEFGQWFRGAMYPYVCDLSPDGKLFLYFAARHRYPSYYDPNVISNWTAISRPPFFTSLALWRIDAFMELGGGVFQENNSVILEADARYTPDRGNLPDGFTVKLNENSRYNQAFLRVSETSGWVQIQKGLGADHMWGNPYIYRKSHPDALYHILQHIRTNGRDHYFAIKNVETGVTTKLQDTRWADFDQHGRIVYGQNGKLFAIPCGKLHEEAVAIADFTRHKVERIKAPKWARTWDGEKSE